MWIKASGFWLCDAAAKDMFVPLDLARLTAALNRDDPACEACTDFVRTDLNPNGFRPSIETSVHALMPQRVVLHVHCVNTIARAIQQNPQDMFAQALAGLDWAFVPYARPGLDLARSIRGVIRPETSILILQNHGLAVAAETTEAAEALLTDVVRRLELPARPAGRPDVERLSRAAQGTQYRLPADEQTHGFALDTWSCKEGATQVFYPDHAVFLGLRLPQDPASGAPALAIPGAGVLVHKDAKPAVEPMIRCLSDVFLRLDGREALKPLTHAEIGALLNWDAEKYRQSLKT